MFWGFFETFLISRRIHQIVIINVHRSSCKVPVIQIVIQLKFSKQIFEKRSNIKNPYWRSRVGPCGQAGKHDEAYSGLAHFAVAP